MQIYDNTNKKMIKNRLCTH